MEKCKHCGEEKRDHVKGFDDGEEYLLCPVEFDPDHSAGDEWEARADEAAQAMLDEQKQQGGKVAWAIPYEYGEGPEIAILQLQEHSDEQDRRIDAVCVRMYARYCRLTDLVQGLLNREGNG